MQMHYFGDNFDFIRLYLTVIIYKISIEQALLKEMKNLEDKLISLAKAENKLLNEEKAVA